MRTFRCSAWRISWLAGCQFELVQLRKSGWEILSLPATTNAISAATVNFPVELSSGLRALRVYQSWMCICIGENIFTIILCNEALVQLYTALSYKYLVSIRSIAYRIFISHLIKGLVVCCWPPFDDRSIHVLVFVSRIPTDTSYFMGNSSQSTPSSEMTRTDVSVLEKAGCWVWNGLCFHRLLPLENMFVLWPRPVCAQLQCTAGDIFIFYSHVKIKVGLHFFISIAPLITLKLM